MKINNKSVLIHNDTQNNQTTLIVVNEKEILEKTKAFLKQISKKYSPLGIILSTTDKNDGFTVAYEKDKFVIVAPNDAISSAKLYGNWDEALVYAHKLMTRQNKNGIVLAQYVKNS